MVDKRGESVALTALSEEFRCVGAIASELHERCVEQLLSADASKLGGDARGIGAADTDRRSSSRAGR